MSTSQKESASSNALPIDLKAEQTLGLIGLGLMQKISKEVSSGWDWASDNPSEKADLSSLRQRLELTALAIDTGAPLTTSEVSHLLGAKPGSSKATRGGLVATRLSRNVWKLSKTETDSAYWRN